VISKEDVHYIKEDGHLAECPGNAYEPKAKEGNLCLYEKYNYKQFAQYPLRSLPGGEGPEGVAPFGTIPIFLDHRRKRASDGNPVTRGSHRARHRPGG
jgi:hypothetical protein